MKFDFKRAGMLLMALMLPATVPGRLFPAALAAEETAASHVFQYMPSWRPMAAANLGRGGNTPEIHVCFQAAVNENAAVGEGIANLAHLDYANSADVPYGAGSAAAKAYTGGVHIGKTDSPGTPLAGAAFPLARLAAEPELASPPAGTVRLRINGASHLTGREDGENEGGEIVDNTITLVGAKFIIPETSGMGSAVFHLTGTAVLGAACLLLLSNRNRRM